MISFIVDGTQVKNLSQERPKNFCRRAAKKKSEAIGSLAENKIVR